LETLRTPEDRFEELPGFEFEPHYAELSDQDGGRLRAHYVDEGPRHAEPVLLMHGEPSWCYLYRKLVIPLVEGGNRVIAPDLVGFGRSDKPTSREDHSYARHVEWMRELLFDHLELRGVTLVGQDWGGLIGLRLVGEHPARFARVVAANTGLPTGDFAMTDAFKAWQDYSQNVPALPVGRIVNGGCLCTLPAEVVAAYEAPFPDESFKEGARILPALVPTRPDDPAAPAQRAAWEVLRSWDKPFLTAFSDGDPITRGGDAVFQGLVPGAAGMPHRTIEGAGHFLQEDRGEELARVVASFIAST
jgi:haloalkane dehalogenase